VSAHSAEGNPSASPRGPIRGLLAKRESIRRAIEVTRISLRGLAQSSIPRMAAALSYRTIFSLVPVLFLGVAVVGSFVTEEQLETQVERLLDASGLSDITVDPKIADADIPDAVPEEAEGPPDAPADEQAATPAADTGAEDRIGLEEWITSLVERVQSIRLEAIGIVGLLLLIWAAISMLVELERSFDSICGVRTQRTWARRITTYWTVITLGLVLLLATFRGGQEVGTWVTRQLAEGEGPAWLGPFVERGINLIINISLLALGYITVPSTRIRLGPALVGAAVAGTFWELAKGLFTAFLVGGGLERLYGVVALLPLFLLWVYVTWCAVLIGLQIAYAMQHFDVWVQRFDAEQRETTTSVVDPAAILALGVLLVRRFKSGRPITADDAADATGLPAAVTREMLDQLATARVAHRLADDAEEGAYALAAPPEEISAVRVLLAGEAIGTQKPSDATRVIDELARQRRESLTGRTLADIASGGHSPGGSTPSPEPSATPAIADTSA